MTKTLDAGFCRAYLGKDQRDTPPPQNSYCSTLLYFKEMSPINLLNLQFSLDSRELAAPKIYMHLAAPLLEQLIVNSS